MKVEKRSHGRCAIAETKLWGDYLFSPSKLLIITRSHHHWNLLLHLVPFTHGAFCRMTSVVCDLEDISWSSIIRFHRDNLRTRVPASVWAKKSFSIKSPDLLFMTFKNFGKFSSSVIWLNEHRLREGGWWSFYDLATNNRKCLWSTSRDLREVIHELSLAQL